MRYVAVFMLALCGLLGDMHHAASVLPDEILDNPTLEARARALSQDLRCLVCQNETIDESSAPLARDLRLLIREKLQAGEGDNAIIAFITARYGQFVWLRPPFNRQTFILWLSPLIILAAAFSIIFTRIYKRKAKAKTSHAA